MCIITHRVWPALMDWSEPSTELCLPLSVSFRASLQRVTAWLDEYMQQYVQLL